MLAFVASCSMIDGVFAEQRPIVRLEQCTPSLNLACNAPFCLTVRTEGWDQLPQDGGNTSNVSLKFSGPIRDQEGQPLPNRRFTVTLEHGTDHARTLCFQTDDGPLLFEYVGFLAYLTDPISLDQHSPDDRPFDIAQNRVSHRISGDACLSYLQPGGWFGRF